MLSYTVTAVEDFPIVKPGDDLGTLIVQSLDRVGYTLKDRDVVVVASKVVSKAEGALVHLSEVKPSWQANAIASASGRDPRLCQVIFEQSQEVLKVVGRVIVVYDRLGMCSTSAGVDRSNVSDDQEQIALMPDDPDESAARIRATVRQCTGKDVAVIVNDTFGRKERLGAMGWAVGIAGIASMEVRQQQDLYGNPARSATALVDELAAAASVLMGQADEKVPVVIVSGAPYTRAEDARLTEMLAPLTQLKDPYDWRFIPPLPAEEAVEEGTANERPHGRG